MKILIVSAYGKCVSGLASFEQYKIIIREVLVGKQEMLDTELEFFIRDRDNIDEFLYEIDSSYVRVECGKMFDAIDLIFFEGDANLRPWSPSAYKFLILLRMCLRSNKILFASSFALQGLVFLIASNIEQNMSIVNGLNGGQLGDLSKIRKNLSEIRQSDYFLDNVTGDLYGFNYDTGEWISKGNAGIHYRRAAEEFKTIGKYVVKAPQYKSTRMKELDMLYISKENEALCSIRKHSMHHYILQDLPFEFVVPFKNSWDVHPFNFVNPKKTFQTLADGEKGPMVLSITDNIVATQFNISKKYKETVTIMWNFVGYQLTKLCSGRAQSIPIELASIKLNDNAMDVYLESLARNKLGQKKNIKFNVITEFHHAGYAAKKSVGLDVVINNAIGKARFKQTVQKEASPLEKFFEKQDQSQIPEQPQYPQYSLHQQQELPPIIKEEFRKTSNEIKLLLHPTVDKTHLPENKQLWVPGFLSTQQTARSQAKLSTFSDDQTYIKKHTMSSTVLSRIKQTPFRTIQKDRWVSNSDFKI